MYSCVLFSAILDVELLNLFFNRGIWKCPKILFHSCNKIWTISTEKFNIQRLYLRTYLMHYYNNFPYTCCFVNLILFVMDNRLDSSGETKRKFESVYSGGTMNTPDSGKVFQYWHCCASEDPFDPGCTASPHCSYDDWCILCMLWT